MSIFGETFESSRYSLWKIFILKTIIITVIIMTLEYETVTCCAKLLGTTINTFKKDSLKEFLETDQFTCRIFNAKKKPTNLETIKVAAGRIDELTNLSRDLDIRNITQIKS